MQMTANLGLKKPDGTDVVNIQDFNDNADLLDNYVATTATLVGTKAPLASPVLTGTPTAPTAAVDTSTTQVATTAFVLGQAGAAAPTMNGAAGVGTSKRYARADHVHPVDTSRAAQMDFAAHASAVDPHAVYIKHALATAVNDFLVSSGAGAFVKKTLAEVKAILGLGSAAYTDSSAYATATQGTKADNAIPSSQKGVANGLGTLNSDGTITSSQRTAFAIAFGNGMDGNVTISADTTLTRDMYYDNLTINSGKILYNRGYKIFVKGTLTNNGTISNNGADASGTSGGLGGYINGSLVSNAQGKGGNGGSSGGNGSSGSDNYWGGNGGSGGVVSPYTGGAGGSATPTTARALCYELLKDIFYTDYSGGGGGGGAGASGSFTSAGAGGGGGGVIHIYADKIINYGSIKAQGGNGSLGTFDAQSHQSASGGGGGGGMILLIYRSLPTRGTISVAGGVGGGLVNSISGTAGNAGNSGVIKEIVMV